MLHNLWEDQAGQYFLLGSKRIYLWSVIKFFWHKWVNGSVQNWKKASLEKLFLISNQVGIKNWGWLDRDSAWPFVNSGFGTFRCSNAMSEVKKTWGITTWQFPISLGEDMRWFPINVNKPFCRQTHWKKMEKDKTLASLSGNGHAKKNPLTETRPWRTQTPISSRYTSSHLWSLMV